jgi:DNA primase
MALINQEEINNIRSSVDIVDLVSGYIPLTQRGKNYFGVCPFHDDHSPSMSVSKEKQIYTCFSCGATGNAFNFIMDYEHVSFLESVKIAASKAGIDIKIDTNTKVNDNKLYEIYEVSSKYFQNNLSSNMGLNAREYLNNRGINDQVINEFKIGLSLKEKDNLTNLLIKKEYKANDLVDLGLSSKSPDGYHDMYHNRIMFPLWDLTGKVVGYSGRVYNGEDTSKYINTKETVIFKKGEMLYNYHRAKDKARQKQTVYVMEGFMDVIAAYIVGVDNVVATMGTAVTKEQANLLKRIAKNIVLCFDGDDAGKKAAYACSNELLNIGVIPSVVIFEDNLDPDEYIKKHGESKFLSKINNPISVMDFKLSYLKENKDVTNSVDMSKYVNEMLSEINKINDDVLRQLSLQKLSEESNLDIEFLTNKIKPIIKVTPVYKPVIKVSKYEKAERNLLYYMLNNQEVIKIYNKNISCLPSKLGRSLANKINDFYSKYNTINVADLITSLTDEEMIKYVGDILSLNLNDIYKIDEINDYINAINDFNYEVAISKLNERLKLASTKEDKLKIAEEMMKIKLGREENE